MNDASQHALTKMKEDSKILMADTSMMDDDAKTWYKMARHHSREGGGDAAATGSAGATTASHSTSAMAIVGTPEDLSYTEMLCVLVTLATSDTGVTSPRPEHHRQAGRN
jgi:hypothetical protein